jgi:hypothetical protein
MSLYLDRKMSMNIELCSHTLHDTSLSCITKISSLDILTQILKRKEKRRKNREERKVSHSKPTKPSQHQYKITPPSTYPQVNVYPSHQSPAQPSPPYSANCLPASAVAQTPCLWHTADGTRTLSLDPSRRGTADGTLRICRRSCAGARSAATLSARTGAVVENT